MRYAPTRQLGEMRIFKKQKTQMTQRAQINNKICVFCIVCVLYSVFTRS